MPEQLTPAHYQALLDAPEAVREQAITRLTPEEVQAFGDYQHQQQVDKKTQTLGPNPSFLQKMFYDPQMDRKDANVASDIPVVGDIPPEAAAGGLAKLPSMLKGMSMSGAGGQVADFAKMVAMAKVFQALDLPPWMAMALGGGGKKAAGGLGALEAEEGAALGGGPSLRRPTSSLGNSIAPMSEEEYMMRSGGKPRLGSTPPTASPAAPMVTRPSMKVTGVMKEDPELESILDATNHKVTGNGAGGPRSLGNPDTAGLKGMKNIDVRRTPADVKEQVGRGVGGQRDNPSPA